MYERDYYLSALVLSVELCELDSDAYILGSACGRFEAQARREGEMKSHVNSLFDRQTERKCSSDPTMGGNESA